MMKRILLCALALMAARPVYAGDAALYRGDMGFAPWPYDLTVGAVEDTYRHIRCNGTMISHHLDNGVPWEPMLRGEALPANIIDDWRGRLQRSGDEMKVFLSVNPLNIMRDGLALNWTEKGDNLPLPAAWAARSFDDPKVINAYTNYALKAVEFFKPDYLAIGVEVNILISLAPEKWEPYTKLNRAVYQAVKAKYPDLPVFASIQYEHFRGIETASQANVKYQKPAVSALLQHSDLLALGTYKYGFIHPNKINDHYFDAALEYNKPIAITESGAIAQTTVVQGLPLVASEKNQKEFVSMILSQAAKHDFEFVIHWLTIDFDKTLAKMPKEHRAIAKSWVHTGLWDANKKPRPAYHVWKTHLADRAAEK